MYPFTELFEIVKLFVSSSLGSYMLSVLPVIAIFYLTRRIMYF